MGNQPVTAVFSCRQIAEADNSRKGKLYGQRTPALAPAVCFRLWGNQEGSRGIIGFPLIFFILVLYLPVCGFESC